MKQFFSNMDYGKNISLEARFMKMLYRLTGFKCDIDSIIRLNREKLSVYGDLYFLTSFKFWKTILGDKLDCHENCTDILQHYAHTRHVIAEQTEATETNKKIVQSLLSHNSILDSLVIKFILTKERVCLFLNRPLLTRYIIYTVLQEDKQYGVSECLKEAFKISYIQDDTSSITSRRLHLLRETCGNLLAMLGHTDYIEGARTIMLTSSNSQYITSDENDIYVCGAVKNPLTNTKERTLTDEEYFNVKFEALTKINEQKYFNHENKPDILDKYRIMDIADAAIKFELLSVKPSRPVFMNLHTDTGNSLTNTKGAPFILYNTARIRTMLLEYRQGRRKGIYPPLDKFNNIDFSVLSEEDEWELVLNFLAAYPEVLENSMILKPTLKMRPHIICMFLSQLSKKFSSYYKRTKILMPCFDNRYSETYNEHIHMQVNARIKLLEALDIVFTNALKLLDIKPILEM